MTIGKTARRVLWGAFVFSSLMSLLGVFLVMTRPDLGEFEGYYAAQSQRSFTVRFAGNSTLLFTDGTTSILVDGWFTRPSIGEILSENVAPDIGEIEHSLMRLGQPEVAALVVAHSHFDHAMDCAEVSKRTGAVLVGSRSTVNVARGMSGKPLHKSQIHKYRPGETLSYGSFRITLIKSKHIRHSNWLLRKIQTSKLSIDEPLTPPASITSYGEGEVYSVHIEHPAGSVLIHASAGYVEGALEGYHADTVFLGISGLMSKGTMADPEAYWSEVVSAVGATKVIPIHWDSLTTPLSEVDEYPSAPNRLENNVLGTHADGGIKYVIERAKGDGIDVKLLPMWIPVDPFDQIPLMDSAPLH